MLYEYNAKVHPYGLYGDTKVDEMPYQNDPDAVADDLFDAIPKFSQLMPKASELKDATAIAKLPQLKADYEKYEADKLDIMRKPNPLLNEDWGKSKMEIIAEAKKYKAEEDRKQKLLGMLDEYTEEDETRRELKNIKLLKEQAISKFLDSAIE